MIQGTTPTIILRLPMPVTALAEAEFVLADYEGQIKRKWLLNEMEADDTTLRVRLTQEETLMLEPTLHKAQLRVRSKDGQVMATKIMTISVQDLIATDVI